ncbi:MAG TPA: zinc-dependent alcohol dehydrogenase family protein [Hanamia sp.]|nr:zinc-dependent alcohol dehydrogenase family protein [Hanamia sp.]
MKSIVFKQAGNWTDVLTLEDTYIEHPKDNEVQINISARPLNPSDAMFIQGIYRKKPSFPQIAGLEGAGVIEKCGQAVDKALLGKRVAFRARGTWAEKINLSIGDFKILPCIIPFEVACQLSLNTLTAFALLDKAHLSENQWLLLTAAHSSVCQQIIQIAKQRNIKVVAVVRKNEHIKRLQSLGATFVINSEKQDLVKEINENIREGINATLDAVGGVIGSALFKVAALNSKIIVYGGLSNNFVSFTNGDIVYKNLLMEGFGIDAWIKSKSADEINLVWKTIISSITNKTLIVHYDKVYSLTDFKQAIHEYEKTGRRIILKNSVDSESC